MYRSTFYLHCETFIHHSVELFFSDLSSLKVITENCFEVSFARYSFTNSAITNGYISEKSQRTNSCIAYFRATHNIGRQHFCPSQTRPSSFCCPIIVDEYSRTYLNPFYDRSTNERE